MRALSLAVLQLLLVLALPSGAQMISDPNITTAVEMSAPPGLSVVWSSAEHLIDGTLTPGALEASAAEFHDAAGDNFATALVLKTECDAGNPNGVYPHDYRRCGSIHVREVVEVVPTSILGGEFHLLESLKGDTREHAVGFLVVDETQYSVDSEMIATLYGAKCGGPVFNFQIWAADPTTTTSIVSGILTHLASVKAVAYANTTPKVVPDTLLNVAQFVSGELGIAATSLAAGSADLTVLAWTPPNPVPHVAVHPVALPTGLEVLTLAVDPAAALATEFEVQVHNAGGFVDSVLVSANHFGEHSSSWIPFASGGSAVSLLPVTDFPPAALPGGFSLNGSTVELTCTLVAGGFCGAFMDLLPEREDALDLREFDLIAFDTKRLQAGALQSLEVKIETASGPQYSQFVTVAEAWERHELLLADFVPGQSWEQIASDIDRITLAVVNGGGGSAGVSTAFGNLSVHRPPVLSVDVIGEGSVDIPGHSLSCDSLCSVELERDTTTALVAVPDAGFRFAGLAGDPDCGDASVALSRDAECFAMFEDLSLVVPGELELTGTAAGGTIELLMGPISLSVQVSAGQSADQAAAAVAAAINGSLALQTAGITASSSGSTVNTNGSLHYVNILDAGLANGAAVPAVGVLGLVLLGLLLGGTGAWAGRLSRR